MRYLAFFRCQSSNFQCLIISGDRKFIVKSLGHLVHPGTQRSFLFEKKMEKSWAVCTCNYEPVYVQEGNFLQFNDNFWANIYTF